MSQLNINAFRRLLAKPDQKNDLLIPPTINWHEEPGLTQNSAKDCGCGKPTGNYDRMSIEEDYPVGNERDETDLLIPPTIDWSE